MHASLRTTTILIVAFAPLLTACLGTRQRVQTPGVTHADFALAIERGRNIVRPLTRRGSGVAVAIGVGGQLVWSEGFGRVSMSDGAPVRPDMPFRVYSLMKQVTAVATLQAAQRGEVDLRAPIRRVIPGLPDAYERVTLGQLLAHTGGVRHYRDSAEAHMTAPCATASDALPRFIGDPLVGEPGVAQRYSTWGFVVASAVLEQAAGMPFDSLIMARIAGPAGMRSIRLEGKGAPTPLGYFDVDAAGVTRATPQLENSCKMGGGGFVASAEDIVRFHNAVLRGELVPLRAARQLLGNRSVLEAGGSGPGGEAVSVVDLDTRVSVVVLSNTGGLEQRIALQRAREILEAVFSPQ